MSRRSLPLDVLRTFAVMLVMWHHVNLGWLKELPLPLWLSRALQRGGWVGVDLFFVLSGFLIAGLLFREHQQYGEIRVRQFLVRRGLKIYPAFYVFLVVTALVRHGTLDDLPVNFLYEAIFLQNYLGAVWGHTWSLAIEEHFYIVLPILLLCLARWRRTEQDPFSAIPKICLAVCTAALGLRLLNVHYYPEFDSMRHFKPTHIRADSLMFGVFLAYLHHYHGRAYGEFFRRYFWLAVGTGLWLWVPVFLSKLPKSPFLYSLGFTQVYVGAGLILSAFVARGLPSTRPLRALGYFGAYSYSTYLWHMPARNWGPGWIEAIFGVTKLTGVAALGSYLGLSLVLGIGTAVLVEVPVLRLRDRLLPSRSKPLVPCGEDAITEPSPVQDS